MHWWIREFVWQVTNDISFAVRSLSRLVAPDVSAGTGCFAPKLRYLFYSPHCALHAERVHGSVQRRRIEWRRSILFNGSSLKARLHSRNGHGSFFSPRYHILPPFGERRIHGQLCGQTSYYAGWHLSRSAGFGAAEQW